MLKTLRPVSNQYQVRYPQIESEFEVQAWLYSALRELGVDARGEVKMDKLDLNANRPAQCRFDIVVYRDQEASSILEVKSSKVTHKRGVENTRQGWRYVRFGVPVHFVYGMEAAKWLVDQVKAQHLQL